MKNIASVKISFFCLITALYTTMPIGQIQAQAFVEDNGLVVIQMESASNIPANWPQETTFNDFTGASYLRYDGSNNLGNPGVDQIQYLVLISNPGLYRFRWRSLIAEGTSTTDANDSWLKIEASAFYGQKGNDSIVCPKGYDPLTNDCPTSLDGDGNVTPAGSGSNGWFKIYRSGPGEWVWSTNTSDNDGHQIYARFDSTGLFTINVAGRSANHAIDRLVMYRDDYMGDPLDTNLPESARIDADIIFIDGFDDAP
ncbi:hypothetical protein [Marinicella sp. W31]|uniref:hypothetical protein n=1 Tax=Marinicella sp. W31 TaxID=3023713 RepID=UPI003758362A